MTRLEGRDFTFDWRAQKSEITHQVKQFMTGTFVREFERPVIAVAAGLVYYEGV